MVQCARDLRAGRLAAFRQQYRCELFHAIDRRRLEFDRPLEVCVFGVMVVSYLQPWGTVVGRNFAGGT
jgi:hypothetical protein